MTGWSRHSSRLRSGWGTSWVRCLGGSKEVIGSESLETVELNLEFDSRRRMVGQEITGGKFITEAEFFADEAGIGDDDGGE